MVQTNKRPRKTQQDKLIDLLVKNRKGVTRKLAESKGINRVSARIFDLRRFGYVIYTNQKKGEYSYRLDDSFRELFNF